MTVVLLLLAACLLRLTSGSQCGNLTQAAPEGPHFVRYVGSKHRLAPDTELEDPAMAVILRGRVLDRHCDPLPGAVVDIWYVGQAGRYSRGQALTNKVIIIHDIMYFHQVLICFLKNFRLVSMNFWLHFLLSIEKKQSRTIISRWVSLN